MSTTRETVLANWEHAEVTVVPKEDFYTTLKTMEENGLDPEENSGNANGHFVDFWMVVEHQGKSTIAFVPVFDPRDMPSKPCVWLNTLGVYSDEKVEFDTLALRAYCQEAATFAHDAGFDIFVIIPNENCLPQGEDFIVHGDISKVFATA